MNSTWQQALVILWKEFSEQRDKRTMLIATLVASIVSIPSFSFPPLLFLRSGLQHGVELTRGTLYTFFSLAAYLIASTIFTTAVFDKERLSGTIEVLLATPLRPVSVWLGKTLFVFIASYSFATFIIWMSTLVINLFRGPSAPRFLPTAQGFVFFFCLFPVLAFSVSAATGFFHLRSSHAVLSRFASGGAASACFIVPVLAARHLMVSWKLLGLVTIFCLLLIGFLRLASLRLDREKLITPVSR